MPNRSIWCRKRSIRKWWTKKKCCAPLRYNSKGRSICGDKKSSDCGYGNTRIFVGTVYEIIKFGFLAAEQYIIFTMINTPDSPSQFVLVLTISEIINLTCFDACTSDNWRCQL
mmetsp:Transcript_50869/g.61228  ORF Transcript_50869/g.61228 Transcript_50869/m.61228 type:complete len:113 (-) Transcript_50869:72-410(-)